MSRHRFLATFLAVTLAAAGAAASTLDNGTLSVTMDPDFPRVIRYAVKAGGATLDGQPDPVGVVELNGKPARCRVTSRSAGADGLEYDLGFEETGISVSILVRLAGPETMEWSFTRLQETGSARLRSLAFPGSAFLTIRSSQSNATLAAVHCTNTRDQFNPTFREHLGPIDSLKTRSDTGNYLFLSAGPLAAGIGSSNPVDIERTSWAWVEKDGLRTLAAGCPSLFFREQDSDPAVMPWVKVFITPDRNGDGTAGWQDAALAHRAAMPRPFGHEFVPSTVGENIAMNFASGAQQPFLRILDGIKKASLATDGLGQQVLIKGFSSEGHDSANSDYAGHWNERAGGLKDFTTLLAQAKAWNARVGIHINASEVYPEARRYNPAILQRDDKGRPKPGWAWLDHAHMIDKHKDIRSGELFAALRQMREALPELDFVYVDTYWENGWPAWMTATEINRLGLPMYTEGAGAVDPWIVWAHWRQINSVVMRFLWHSHRDIFGNDPLLRGGRGDDDGFMGWQNQHNFHNYVRNTFTRHLPAKFLKHFDLLRWEPGVEAVFSHEVRAARTGDTVRVTQDGRLVMTWTGSGAASRLFVPWPPREASKIYAWDDSGAAEAWQLPAAWRGLNQVYQYRLTDLGRVEQTSLPVSNGWVNLALPKSTPFVLYPSMAPPQPEVRWGEGSPVQDPGFDSQEFKFWNCQPSGAEPRFERDKFGNSRLLLSGPDGAGVTASQTLTGLIGGRTYAASVWMQIQGTRESGLVVHPEGGTAVSNILSRTDVRHSAPNDPRTGSNFQRIKVVFDQPAGQSTARLVLAAGPGAPGSRVEFDDVRVVETRRAPEAAGRFFWEDFENVDQGYGPFTGCPNEHTHLSEANPPHTRDTIHGRFSLKSRDKGRVLRTLPSSLPLKPRTRYRLTCETLTDDASGRNSLKAESGRRVLLECRFPEGRGRIQGEFATLDDAGSYLALYRNGGDFIVLDDLALDELGAAPAGTPTPAPPPEPLPPGRKILVEDRFSAPLSREWTVHRSGHPDAQVTAGPDGLEVTAPANVSALVERPVPPGTTGVECLVDTGTEQGMTWGMGLGLFWSGGQAVRVNVRPSEGCFGIDSTIAPQQRTGNFPSGSVAFLRILLNPDTVRVEARNEGEDWQTLSSFPREKFPGEPARVRIGKMHAVEGIGDHSSPGDAGRSEVKNVRFFGAM